MKNSNVAITLKCTRLIALKNNEFLTQKGIQKLLMFFTVDLRANHRIKIVI